MFAANAQRDLARPPLAHKARASGDQLVGEKGRGIVLREVAEQESLRGDNHGDTPAFDREKLGAPVNSFTSRRFRSPPRS